MICQEPQGISIHALLAESDPVSRQTQTRKQPFLSTLSLRRATDVIAVMTDAQSISIHALLAESDVNSFSITRRSVVFLSTLSLRRATVDTSKDIIKTTNFYPRSPCGERHGGALSSYSAKTIFLSTLSLRRATGKGSRRCVLSGISIHALLAESDSTRQPKQTCRAISIHALLAESDSIIGIINNVINNFYPRSPCGERPMPGIGHIS